MLLLGTLDIPVCARQMKGQARPRSTAWAFPAEPALRVTWTMMFVSPSAQRMRQLKLTA